MKEEINTIVCVFVCVGGFSIVCVYGPPTQEKFLPRAVKYE